MSELHLVTQWYSDSDGERNNELMESVCQNIHNPHISWIHFIESEARHVYNQLAPYCNATLAQFNSKARFYPPQGLRLNVEWSDRLTAGSAFRFASRHLPGKTVILANLDIYFDATLRLLKSDQWLSVSSMYFLSRYESDERISIGTQCGPAYMGSHDSFVFVPPLPRALVERTNQLALGMPGMENRMIHDFRRAGIRILNPCKSIRSWHSHRSGVKHLVLPLANNNHQSGIARPSKLIRNPTIDDLYQ